MKTRFISGTVAVPSRARTDALAEEFARFEVPAISTNFG